MHNARLDEAQAGMKIARRNTNNLRYAVDTTLRTESKGCFLSIGYFASFVKDKVPVFVWVYF